MTAAKTILISFLLLLVTGAVTGVPAAIHLCCDEPMEMACAPEDCCGEEEEDSCCETEVTIDAIDDDAAPMAVHQPSPILHVIDLVPVSTASARVDRAPQRLIACAEAHPPPSPDRSVLSIYLI